MLSLTLPLTLVLHSLPACVAWVEPEEAAFLQRRIEKLGETILPRRSFEYKGHEGSSQPFASPPDSSSDDNEAASQRVYRQDFAHTVKSGKRLNFSYEMHVPEELHSLDSEKHIGNHILSLECHFNTLPKSETSSGRKAYNVLFLKINISATSNSTSDMTGNPSQSFAQSRQDVLAVAVQEAAVMTAQAVRVECISQMADTVSSAPKTGSIMDIAGAVSTALMRILDRASPVIGCAKVVTVLAVAVQEAAMMTAQAVRAESISQMADTVSSAPKTGSIMDIAGAVSTALMRILDRAPTVIGCAKVVTVLAIAVREAVLTTAQAVRAESISQMADTVSSAPKTGSIMDIAGAVSTAITRILDRASPVVGCAKVVTVHVARVMDRGQVNAQPVMEILHMDTHGMDTNIVQNAPTNGKNKTTAQLAAIATLKTGLLMLMKRTSACDAMKVVQPAMATDLGTALLACQGEGIDFGEGTAEVYMWSSTFDHLENQMVERAVGLPCVQEVGRTYEYSFQIGAVAIGQGIRVGAWEWDDDTGWSDDSLGDKWILPEDFEQSDPLLTLNTFKDTTFTLRCRGCSQLTGTKPEPFISENPAQTWTVDDLIDEAKEQTGFKLGYMITLDMITEVEVDAELEAETGFDMTWHMQYGYAYTYDTGPVTFAQDSSTTYTAHPTNIQGEVVAAVDIALKPYIAIGIWASAALAVAEASSTLTTEVFLHADIKGSLSATTSVEVTDDYQAFEIEYGSCGEKHNLEYALTSGLRNSLFEMGYTASLGWANDGSGESDGDTFTGYVWANKWGPWDKEYLDTSWNLALIMVIALAKATLDIIQ
ncbi:hypothetical protein CYMTET_55049 [Cymbomonas tetramitiformis]|uniref:Uncharacterized protein n=1 Tax=Cymbomonas tetramitiformis TaxID=36881 RepID=A0AAE0BEV5_9CHLO|nr:hypothetical protein CYMTET_55049 [Cymbomonas tetramitiformis]